jgi:CRISPR-associated protein NE0113 (Cas_NE0113).
MKPESTRKILVAGMGTSPAVLTNAVWALAHQKKSVVPDEIVVFITKNGKTLLKKELFDGGVWSDMLKCLAREGVDFEGKLMFGETSIRSIPDAKVNEIDDLRMGEDNLRAADFMLAQLRQYTVAKGVGYLRAGPIPKDGICWAAAFPNLNKNAVCARQMRSLDFVRARRGQAGAWTEGDALSWKTQ